MLKYPIYVRSISNLSDARYCAGMGVEYLGFCLDKSNENCIETDLFHGIKGWIEGVKIVGEFANVPSDEEIKELNLDHLAILADVRTSKSFSSPLFYTLNVNDIPEILPSKGSFIVLIDNTATKTISTFEEYIFPLCQNYNVFIGFGFNESNIEEINERYKPFGFSLSGGYEIAPGLNNFDGLAEVLEAIEI